MAWADRSPAEQFALRYCAPLGIPLSVFAEGRIVYPGDPMWLPRDVAAAIDWQVHQDRLCATCGGDTAETLAKENSDAYRTSLQYCHRCKAIGRASAKLTGGKENPTAGARFRVWRVEDTDGDVTVGD